jgi:hypothetical protein
LDTVQFSFPTVKTNLNRISSERPAILGIYWLGRGLALGPLQHGCTPRVALSIKVLKSRTDADKGGEVIPAPLAASDR